MIFNFYEHQVDVPKILCTSKLKDKKLLEDMFIEKHQKNLRITHSPSKSIRPIFSLCKLNAQQVIKNHISKRDKYTFAFNELCAYVGQENINKIEAYDVSHISGEKGVASSVVYTRIGPEKKGYRLYNIPNHLTGNDIGSLEHVLERRIKYFNDEKLKPDLLLIDGGKTQLKFVNSVLNKSNHKDLKAISIVKGSNRIRATETIIGKDGILELDKNSKAFLLLQEIRDESHRFAIEAQRKKKRKTISKSELDSIKGIGTVLKMRLLKKFKSIKNIKMANLSDLMTVKGINEKIANNILEKLK